MNSQCEPYVCNGMFCATVGDQSYHDDVFPVTRASTHVAVLNLYSQWLMYAESLLGADKMIRGGGAIVFL